MISISVAKDGKLLIATHHELLPRGRHSTWTSTLFPGGGGPTVTARVLCSAESYCQYRRHVVSNIEVDIEITWWWSRTYYNYRSDIHLMLCSDRLREQCLALLMYLEWRLSRWISVVVDIHTIDPYQRLCSLTSHQFPTTDDDANHRFPDWMDRHRHPDDNRMFRWCPFFAPHVTLSVGSRKRAPFVDCICVLRAGCCPLSSTCGGDAQKSFVGFNCDSNWEIRTGSDTQSKTSAESMIEISPCLERQFVSRKSSNTLLRANPGCRL